MRRYILKYAILSTYGQSNNNYKQFRSKLGSHSFIWYITTINRGVADKLGHQVNSDSYAHISSIASCTHNFCIFVISCFSHDFSSMEEGCSNVNDLLQTNILFTILIRLENPSPASIPFLLLSEARLV